jgi:hypothetical protein
MTRNPPDERLVYLALKGVLNGENAQLRRAKKVKKIIQKHQYQVDIRRLINEHPVDSICHVAIGLLKDQVFESTLTAKVRFPEVFEVSPSQTAERAISESEAAKHEDAAIQSVIQSQQPEVSGDEPKLVSVDKRGTNRRCECVLQIRYSLLLTEWSHLLSTEPITPRENIRDIVLSCLFAVLCSASTPCQSPKHPGNNMLCLRNETPGGRFAEGRVGLCRSS